MFNRALKVSVVKSNKEELLNTGKPDMHFERKVAIIGNYFERIVKETGKVVMTYIAMDTVRKVLIEIAKKQ